MRLTALAALVAALAAFPAAALEESKTRRLEERVEKALKESAARSEKAARETLEEMLGGNAPFAVIRRTIRLSNCEEELRFLASDDL